MRGRERLFATSGLATVDLASWPPTLRDREDVIHGVLTPWITTLVQADRARRDVRDPRRRARVPNSCQRLGVERGPVFHYYDEARTRFVLVARRAWHALDWRVIAALPRLSFAAFADQRAALLARKQTR